MKRNGGTLKCRAIQLMLTTFLFSGMMTVNAQAADQTMTFYFAGTNMEEDMYLEPASAPPRRAAVVS